MTRLEDDCPVREGVGDRLKPFDGDGQRHVDGAVEKEQPGRVKDVHECNRRKELLKWDVFRLSVQRTYICRDKSPIFVPIECFLTPGNCESYSIPTY